MRYEIAPAGGGGSPGYSSLMHALHAPDEPFLAPFGPQPGAGDGGCAAAGDSAAVFGLPAPATTAGAPFGLPPALFMGQQQQQQPAHGGCTTAGGGTDLDALFLGLDTMVVSPGADHTPGLSLEAGPAAAGGALPELHDLDVEMDELTAMGLDALSDETEQALSALAQELPGGAGELPGGTCETNRHSVSPAPSVASVASVASVSAPPPPSLSPSPSPSPSPSTSPLPAPAAPAKPAARRVKAVRRAPTRRGESKASKAKATPAELGGTVDPSLTGDDFVDRLFAKGILRAEPGLFSAFKNQHAHRLDAGQLERVAYLRRKERACVHAAKSRTKRLNAKAARDSDNARLRREVKSLKSENTSLRAELARAMKLLNLQQE